MRFGKKLALRVMDDQSGAPYLSHKPMKEAINRTVRELRLYQARLQGTDQAVATPAELMELEERVATLDRQLFTLVDEDLARIMAHVRMGEAQLAARLAAVQAFAIEVGVLVEESRVRRLEGALSRTPEDRATLCRQLLRLRVRSDGANMAMQLAELVRQHNGAIEVANEHAQYLEINVAGFRKLLKRHEKQVPQNFRSRPMPCLGFHGLVTKTSRQLLELTRQLCSTVEDAQRQLSDAVGAADGGVVNTEVAAQAARLCSQAPELAELKGLGPECEMVLNIRRQLKDPVGSQLMQLAAGVDGPVPGFLYPKPEVPAREPPAGASGPVARGALTDQQQYAGQSSWLTLYPYIPFLDDGHTAPSLARGSAAGAPPD